MNGHATTMIPQRIWLFALLLASCCVTSANTQEVLELMKVLLLHNNFDAYLFL